MQTYIRTIERVKLKKPVLVEGLPGIGNVGRIAAGYLVSELKMKKFAELYSPFFLPLVVLHQGGVVSPLKCEFYYRKGRKNDLVVLTGDTQSISPEGHYEVCDRILDFAEKLGVKTIITLGGFAEGEVVEEPRVIGAVNDKNLIKKYGKYGIKFEEEHGIGTIVGASGLLLGLGKLKNMEGLCLMGETVGIPMVTDPRSANKLLSAVMGIIDVRLDLSKLEKTVEEMEENIKKTDNIHKKMVDEITKKKGGDDIKYIG